MERKYTDRRHNKGKAIKTSDKLNENYDKGDN